MKLGKKQQHIINQLKRSGTKIGVTITKHDGRAGKPVVYNEAQAYTNGYVSKDLLASLNRRDLLNIKIYKFPQSIELEYTLKSE
jgi:hypothetical protein